MLKPGHYDMAAVNPGGPDKPLSIVGDSVQAITRFGAEVQGLEWRLAGPAVASHHTVDESLVAESRKLQNLGLLNVHLCPDFGSAAQNAVFREGRLAEEIQALASSINPRR